VTAALAELALELELSGWAPWRLLERGTEWILAPKSELLELLSGVRGLPLKEAKILSEEHKAVLLVAIGYRQKGGVSKSRVGEILGLEASFYLDDLLSFGLIYCDPSRELNFWRPNAIGFACAWVAVSHRHPGAQRARRVVRHAERNAGDSETGSLL
jgi:chromosome segregation and condensation protein ScpB